MSNEPMVSLTKEDFDCLQDYIDYLCAIGISNEMIAVTIDEIERCKPTLKFDEYVRQSIEEETYKVDLCWNLATCSKRSCSTCTTDFLTAFKTEVLKNKKKTFKEHEVQDSEDKVYTTTKTDNVPTKFGYKNDKDFWYNITKLNEKQTAKGLETYGMRLEDNVSVNVIERLTYIEEELIDALKYCEWVKDWLKGTEE